MADPNAVARDIGMSLLRWAGLADDDDRVADVDRAEQFADAIQHSGIPESARTVAEHL